MLEDVNEPNLSSRLLLAIYPAFRVLFPNQVTGDNTEWVDTRALQAIYRFTDAQVPSFVGQQMDVFIESPAQGAAK
jgi:HlyD family secretion protein